VKATTVHISETHRGGGRNANCAGVLGVLRVAR